MELKEKSVSEKNKKSTGSIVLYVAAVVVALIAIALLISNVTLYYKTVAQYVAQGYKAADVSKQLIQTQLLPGIFDPIAVYGGIAFVLLGVGMINQKVSKGLIMLTKTDAHDFVSEEGALQEDAANVENSEVLRQPETIEQEDTDANK
jgi:hypothetical protein